MIVWRISRGAYLAKALSGEGAFRYPGRWNHFGVAMVYTASTLSLAILEYVAHVQPGLAPRDLVMLEVEITNAPSVYPKSKLPKNWRAIPPPNSTRDIGTNWARKNKTLSLGVPSVLMPTQNEFTVLLNPLHADMMMTTILSEHPFDLDQRLAKGEK